MSHNEKNKTINAAKTDVSSSSKASSSKLKNIVAVRLIGESKISYYRSGSLQFKIGQIIIVNSEFGHDAGKIEKICTDMSLCPIVEKDIRPVVRLATHEDLETIRANEKKSAWAYKTTREKIKKHGLDMNLSNVRYLFDENKILFYFTSEHRVDFRDLVRDLASEFHSRIELRQIGARDEAAILGGCGVCGHEQCCSLYIRHFHPISIRMAKDQDLSLNSSKISGNCGRLLCCLQYENDTYRECRKGMPRIGTTVRFLSDTIISDTATKVDPETLEGQVVGWNVIKGTVRIELPDTSGHGVEVPVDKLQ